MMKLNLDFRSIIELKRAKGAQQNSLGVYNGKPL